MEKEKAKLNYYTDEDLERILKFYQNSKSTKPKFFKIWKDGPVLDFCFNDNILKEWFTGQILCRWLCIYYKKKNVLHGTIFGLFEG